MIFSCKHGNVFHTTNFSATVMDFAKKDMTLKHVKILTMTYYYAMHTFTSLCIHLYLFQGVDH